MKAIATALVLSAGLILNAQTPAPKTTAKSTTSKPSASHSTTTSAHPSLLKPDSLKLKAPAVFKAKFATTAGDFVIEVHRDWAPLGADRFYNLVRYGYFTNAAFFRVLPGFVAQFGLSPNPAINKAWNAAKIADDPVLQSNKRGTIVFAMAGPNTRTRQFFINYRDNANLDGQGFAPFGTVIEGMAAVDKLYANYGESPRQDLITEQGDAYLKAHFPDLDKINTAQIVPATPPPAHAPANTHAPAKPSAKPTSKPPQN